MSAASKSVSSLTDLKVPTTYKIKFGDNQFQFFTSGEGRLAVEVGRQMKERESNVILYREDGTGIHLMSLDRLPEKSGSQKRAERQKKLTRAVTNVDELYTPVLSKNTARPRRKSVRKALATA